MQFSWMIFASFPSWDLLEPPTLDVISSWDLPTILSIHHTRRARMVATVPENLSTKPSLWYERFLYVLLHSFLFRVLIFQDSEFLQTKDSLSNSSLLLRLYVACIWKRTSIRSIWTKGICLIHMVMEEKHTMGEKLFDSFPSANNQLKKSTWMAWFCWLLFWEDIQSLNVAVTVKNGIRLHFSSYLTCQRSKIFRLQTWIKLRHLWYISFLNLRILLIENQYLNR